MLPFDTRVTLAGPWREPKQMLDAQVYDGHRSIHDDEVASGLGFQGAAIEGPTHFSQVDPLATSLWGRRWFEDGCVSAHFRSPVVEGERVRVSLEAQEPRFAAIEAVAADGRSVLVGSASVGSPPRRPEAASRCATAGDPGSLIVLDRLVVGTQYAEEDPVSIRFDQDNGPLYPFSLEGKLARITEPHPWYLPDSGRGSPWGRAIVPFEMISILTFKSGLSLPVRTPSVGLFLDLEVRLLSGPVFVDQEYRVEHTLVGLSQSRKTESYWTRSSLTEWSSGRLVARVLLHTGVLKESSPLYRGAAGGAPG